MKKFMKRIVIAGLALFVTYNSAACGQPRPDKTDMTDSTEYRATNYSELSEEEQYALKLAYDFNYDRIGEELSIQEQVFLSDYEFMKEYLKRKYPSYEFVIHAIEVRTKDRLPNAEYVTFHIPGADPYSRLFELKLYRESDGERKCIDNFYWSIVQDEYSAKITRMLQEEIPSCIYAVSRCTDLKGEAFDENFDLDDVLGGIKILDTLTGVFVLGDSDNAEQIAEEAKKKIEKIGVPGSYFVNIIADMPELDKNSTAEQNFSILSQIKEFCYAYVVVD